MYSIYKKIFWLNFFIVITIAFNLRVPITSIGPVIDTIKEYYLLNSTLAGMLTTLPLISFGVISFFVGYFSPLKTMVMGIVLIFIGEFLRSYAGYLGLFLGMLFLGCGIAIANVLLPSFIKEKFPNKISSMMGVYSLMLSISSIAGIFLAIPLLNFLGIKGSMAFWMIFALLALIIYYPQAKNGRFLRTKKKIKKNINLFKNSTAWKVTLFMGLQSFLAYSIFSWYIQFIIEKGYSKEFATHMILFAQIVAVPVSLFGPLLLGKIKHSFHSIYIATLCSLYVISFALLFFFDSKEMIILCSFFIGFPWGGVFGIALLFIAQKSSNAQIATKLSSFAQGFGYLIAAQAPWIIGFMHDKFENFQSSILMLLFASILVNIFGYLSLKSSKI
ncbi:CynX/NimT family MFS transporter [Campylobacter sp. 2018MI35]|uniref:MFS transporter n=1 Tax=Campylobacter sp. 2018MI34 TaxID=2800582 RepID=UPI001907DB4E|nr:CynX/NimT family MFS transporter [Campylobacter sp. 2018MI34]MBK1992246.1 CynX/NimT family MFS transporter [Campylobacter sp. 2018MI34]